MDAHILSFHGSRRATRPLAFGSQHTRQKKSRIQKWIRASKNGPSVHTSWKAPRSSTLKPRCRSSCRTFPCRGARAPCSKVCRPPRSGQTCRASLWQFQSRPASVYPLRKSASVRGLGMSPSFTAYPSLRGGSNYGDWGIGRLRN